MGNRLFGPFPNEITLKILDIVAAAPAPSRENFTLDPSLDLTKSDSTPLKNLSLTCKEWRALVLPHLFVYARVTLDPRPAWLRLHQGLVDDVRMKTMTSERVRKAMNGNLSPRAKDIHGRNSRGRWDIMYLEPEDGQGIPLEHMHWIPSPRGSVEEFLYFLSNEGLASYVETLAVLVEDAGFPSVESIDKTVMLRETAVLWRTIFDAVDLKQVTGVASPTMMGVMMACEQFIFLRENPTVVRYEYLTFRVPKSTIYKMEIPDYSSIHARNQSLILHIRPWSHIGYNGGTDPIISPRSVNVYTNPAGFHAIDTILNRLRLSGRTAPLQSLEYTFIAVATRTFTQTLDQLWEFPNLREFSVKLSGPDFGSAVGEGVSDEKRSMWIFCQERIQDWLSYFARSETVFRSRDTENPMAMRMVETGMDNLKRPAQTPSKAVVRRMSKPYSWVRL